MIAAVDDDPEVFRRQALSDAGPQTKCRWQERYAESGMRPMYARVLSVGPDLDGAYVEALRRSCSEALASCAHV